MDDPPYRLPPDGVSPITDAGQDLAMCRHKDGKSVIVYATTYRPENDPDYEDPEESAHGWQNREDAIDVLEYYKTIYEVIAASEPKTHPHVQKLTEIQPETNFVVLEEIPRGNLYQFLSLHPHPQIPTGKGSTSDLAIKLRWALHVASALSFLHAKDITYYSLCPSTIGLRNDLSAVLIDMSGAAYQENHGCTGAAEGYGAPGRRASPLPGKPESWLKPWQDIFAFGSLLYFFVMEKDPDYKCGGEFPTLEGVRGGDIIGKCWRKEYGSIGDVAGELRKWVREEGLEMDGEWDLVVDESIGGLDGFDEFKAHGVEAT